MRVPNVLPVAASVALFVASVAGGDCGEAAARKALEATWSTLLEKAFEHSPEARAEVEEESTKGPPDSALPRLAQRLLEEWDLPPEDDSLSRPRLIWRPEIDFSSLPDEALQVSAPRAIVEGEVTPEGKLLHPAVIRSSGSQLLDDACLAIASKALYRPAWSDGILVSSRAVIVFHLDPR